MWEWTLNWNRIRDDLLIGSCPMTAADMDLIRAETGATALLSLQTEYCRQPFGIDWEHLRAHGEQIQMALVNAPMLDFDPPDQRRNLPQAVRSLHDLLAAGHIVYVHDTAGCGRAPLAALGYMTFVEMRRAEEAMREILDKRPNASPSWEAYEGCRQDLLEMLRDYIMVRAYYLAQEEPEHSPDDHWLRAESEMIRDSFVAGRTPPRRLDPARSGMDTADA
jgi:hypothetical protein